jgi:hypothetical protein
MRSSRAMLVAVLGLATRDLLAVGRSSVRVGLLRDHGEWPLTSQDLRPAGRMGREARPPAVDEGIPSTCAS